MRIIALPRGMTPPRIERKALAPIEKLHPKELEEEPVVVMLTPSANSLVELSLCPAFRRRWPSAYEALENGRIDRDGLVGLYVGQPLESRPLLAGVRTPWPRVSMACAEPIHDVAPESDLWLLKIDDLTSAAPCPRRLSWLGLRPADSV
jgi:hypothetical protein